MRKRRIAVSPLKSLHVVTALKLNNLIGLLHGAVSLMREKKRKSKRHHNPSWGSCIVTLKAIRLSLKLATFNHDQS